MTELIEKYKYPNGDEVYDVAAIYTTDQYSCENKVNGVETEK